MIHFARRLPKRSTFERLHSGGPWAFGHGRGSQNSQATITLSVILLTLCPTLATAGDTVTLSDGGASSETVARVVTVSGEGTFSFQGAPSSEEEPSQPVAVDATYKFLERRLPGTGPDAGKFRAFRRYAEARSRIDVGKQAVERTLRDQRRRIVTWLTPERLEVHSPEGPLTATEIELLPTPGDHLMLAALLPNRSVKIEEQWSPEDWVGGMLAGLDVSLEQDFTCRLASAKDDKAVVTFTGDIKGGVKGTTSTTEISGEFTFDLQEQRIVSATITHHETREVGPLSPGMDITLQISMRSRTAPESSAIPDANIAEISDAPPDTKTLKVEHRFPWGVSLVCNRQWQLFRRSEELLILRLLEDGGIIAQCNLIRAETVEPGKRTDERQFQQGIHDSLGAEFEEIVKAEEFPKTEDKRIYRVIAVGGTEQNPRQWRYYLVTAPDGRQVSFVFTVEPRFVDRLGDRDLELVKAVRFEKIRDKTPTPAE